MFNDLIMSCFKVYNQTFHLIHSIIVDGIAANEIYINTHGTFEQCILFYLEQTLEKQ